MNRCSFTQFISDPCDFIEINLNFSVISVVRVPRCNQTVHDQ